MTELRIHHVNRVFLYLSALMILFFTGCSDDAISPSDLTDMAPFIAMAKAASCADIRNNLYLIDGELVFWDKAGSCEDASYSQTLFGDEVEDVLCYHGDSIGGPVTQYFDETYKELFDTMVANIDQAKLGLGDEHSVRKIQF